MGNQKQHEAHRRHQPRQLYKTLRSTFTALAIILSAPTLAVADSVKIKISPSQYGGSISVLCKLDDLDMECKLDTGTNMSSVRARAENSMYPSLGRLTERSVSGSTASCDLIRVENFSLGIWEQSKFELARCPSPASRSDINLLGLDFLRNQVFVLDYKAEELRFGNSVQQPNEKSLFQFANDQTDHIIVPMQVKSKDRITGTHAMVDTGAAVTIVSHDLVKAHPEAFALISETSAGTDTHGNPLTSKLYIVSQLIIGNVKIVAEYAMAIDFTAIQSFAGRDVEAILGHNVLSEANWYFDLPNNNWSNWK